MYKPNDELNYENDDKEMLAFVQSFETLSEDPNRVQKTQITNQIPINRDFTV